MLRKSISLLPRVDISCHFLISLRLRQYNDCQVGSLQRKTNICHSLFAAFPCILIMVMGAYLFYDQITFQQLHIKTSLKLWSDDHIFKSLNSNLNHEVEKPFLHPCSRQIQCNLAKEPTIWYAWFWFFLFLAAPR